MIRPPHKKTTTPDKKTAKPVEEGRAVTKPKKRKPIRPQDAVPPPPLPPQVAANADDEEADDDIPELPAPVDSVELLDDESASSESDGEEVDGSDGEE